MTSPGNNKVSLELMVGIRVPSYNAYSPFRRNVRAKILSDAQQAIMKQHLPEYICLKVPQIVVAVTLFNKMYLKLALRAFESKNCCQVPNTAFAQLLHFLHEQAEADLIVPVEQN